MGAIYWWDGRGGARSVVSDRGDVEQKESQNQRQESHVRNRHVGHPHQSYCSPSAPPARGRRRRATRSNATSPMTTAAEST
jgi:hypothetical protein